MRIIFVNFGHSSSIKSIIEENLPAVVALLIGRSIGEVGVIAVGEMSGPDAVGKCTEMYKNYRDYSLNLWQFIVFFSKSSLNQSNIRVRLLFLFVGNRYELSVLISKI